ncbi:putative meiosis-specific serine threonine-protein kinase mek1 protein [Phaeoacremonium minimum UCRPA7]|uniref:Autophagy-related protein 1 n=1 Tax=Phaeoacremonium minimum (strain UCR-PA7) TaxID=1286976 RepID=R8BD82_PHAM7|nr:putative meiosis-specific serine threonine-protein kinase mek1 protein [Phaeoacremonium minimum UCRPA7]EON97264.1 putative meiosis-specific serine threonine-protein kinase mek1 protein [Phaeoacremonium minimum UCRPA7]
MDPDGDSQPTQQATQNVVDPRRLGKQNSGFSDDDISDIVCLLLPYSDSARREVSKIALRSSRHMVARDDADNVDIDYALEDDAERFELTPRSAGEHAIVLRLSADVKNPLQGFTFGRNASRCDICFTNDPHKRLSNIHFRIYLNEYGVLMLEDQSTNGTIVDGTLLRAKSRPREETKRTLTSGTKIQILMHAEGLDLEFLVRIPRREGEYERAYRENLISYMHRLQSMYNRVGQIGKGAFATVYKVTSKFDGKPYAAKELDKRKFMKNGVLDQKVENEMNIMQKIEHPHIVSYIEHLDWDDRLFIIIMEYVPAGDLGRFITDRGPLPEITVKEMSRQLIDALGYLHTNNITHRDVKPDNILIQSHQPFYVKLTDFGLSKMVDNEQTFLRTFCGTLLYCAPEVYTEFAEYDEYGRRHPRNKHRRQPYGQRPSPVSCEDWN